MERSYYLMSAGDLRRKDNTLQFIGLDGQKRNIPIETVYDLFCFSDINFNADLMEFLGAKGIAVLYFNYYGYYSGTFYPREKLVSGALLVKQVEHYSNEASRILLAKKFVFGASENILRNIKYYNVRGKDLEMYIEQIKMLQNELDDMDNVNSVMGIEGNIRKVYYDTWETILNNEYEFQKRVKQPPDNVVNTLISFLNGVTYSKVLAEIYKTQLNPTISYLHEPSTKRFSLALDVAEIFKPLIVDRLIFALLNKKIIQRSDFDDNAHGLRIKENSLKKIMKEYEDVLCRTINHRTLNRQVSYKQLIRLECYKISKHLLGDKEYEPFKIWW